MGVFNNKKTVKNKVVNEIDTNAIPELEKFRIDYCRNLKIPNSVPKKIIPKLMESNEEKQQKFYGWLYRSCCDFGVNILDKNNLDVLDQMRDRVGKEFYFDSFRLFIAGMENSNDTDFALKTFSCDHDGVEPSDRGLFLPIDKESFKKCMDMSDYNCIQDIVTGGERALYDYGRFVCMPWDDSREILKYAKVKACQYAEYMSRKALSKINLGKSEMGVSSDGIAPSQEECEME